MPTRLISNPNVGYTSSFAPVQFSRNQVSPVSSFGDYMSFYNSTPGYGLLGPETFGGVRGAVIPPSGGAHATLNQGGGCGVNMSCLTNDQKYANSVQSLAGKPYLLGANGPDAYDCSSAVCSGIRSENPLFGDYTAHDLFKNFTLSVDKASLERGNLMFYDYTSDGRIDHVTTVLDANRMLHPSSGSGELLITPRTYLDNYTSERGGTIYYRAIDWDKVSP